MTETLNGYPVIRGTNMGPMFGAPDLPQGVKLESDPNGLPLNTPGAKADAGKCAAGVLHDFSLALRAVADVGTMGAAKYSRGGWQAVPNGEDRYFDALWRHLLAARHEELDPESGLPHMDHALWNLTAVVELRKRGAM